MTISSPPVTCYPSSYNSSNDCHATITYTDSISNANCYPNYTGSVTIGSLASNCISSISATGSINISISNGGTSNCYTIGGGLGAGYSNNFSFNIPEEWVNTFPDFDRIQEMCKEYPGLKIAFDKFKTVYKLVKDHYDTPEDQRPLP